jgi:hypothetical protein
LTSILGGQTLKGMLSDWTIHSAPEPAHPSFRLVTALRLYHSIPMEETSPPEDETEVQAWQGTIAGNQDIVSLDNERAWRETLEMLCQAIENESGIYLDKLDEVKRKWPDDAWIRHMRSCSSMLWREQQHVARCVRKSLQQGEEF